MSNHYIRFGTATIKEIVDAVLENQKLPFNLRKKLKLQGHKVGIGSLRLVTFAKACKDGKIHCVGCGLEASFFSIDSFYAVGDKTSAHLNLYGRKPDQFGVEQDVLFTHDHILARALGGVDSLENTQVMCSPCNNKKSRVENKLAVKMKAEKEALLNPVDPKTE